jgi:hypothetical protein
MWKDLDDSAVSVDMDEFLSLFKEGKEMSAAVAAPAGPAVVQLIESNKAKSVVILLSGLKMPGQVLVEKLKALSSESFTESQLTSLRSVAPTKEDYDVLHAYTGDRGQLGACERFFLDIEGMQLLVPHLDFLLLSKTARSNVAEVNEMTRLIIGSLQAVRESALLRDALRLVLRLGNIMNGGTRRGGAYGFSISFLPRIVDVKSLQPGVTLLHFLAQKIRVADLAAELPDIARVAKISFDSLKGNLAEAAAEMAKLQKAMEPAQALVLQGYTLFPRFSKFAEEINPLIAATKGLLGEVDKLFGEVAVRFGEDPAKVSLIEFLQYIDEFVNGLKKAAEDNERMRVAAELAAKKAERAMTAPAGGKRIIDAVQQQVGQRGCLDELEKVLAARQQGPRVPLRPKPDPKKEPETQTPAQLVQLRKVPPK